MSASSSAAAAAAARSAFLRGLYRRPALLLVVTTLIWGSNAVAARLAVGHVSPMMLTTARWSIACIALWLVARQQVAQHWPALRGRWTYLALMGISGFTAFNALFYAAAHHTTAVNLSLIQGMIPVLVLLGGVMFFGLRVTALQMAGVVITLAGVAVVASRGSWAALAALDINVGDAWILLASLLYAGYTLGLRARPVVPPLVFFSAVAGVAALASLPLPTRIHPSAMRPTGRRPTRAAEMPAGNARRARTACTQPPILQTGDAAAGCGSWPWRRPQCGFPRPVWQTRVPGAF